MSGVTPEAAARAKRWKHEAQAYYGQADMLWQNRTAELARDVLALLSELATARQALREIADEAVNRRTEAPLTKIHAIAVTWDSARDLNEDGPALAAEEEMIRLRAELVVVRRQLEVLREWILGVVDDVQIAERLRNEARAVLDAGQEQKP